MVSTRALYGNFKFRPPFPRLEPERIFAPGRADQDRLPLRRFAASLTRRCSICRKSFEDRRQHRVWISLRVATDVLPLLVNACSAACLAKLPPAEKNYVPRPHRGGVGVLQPAR